MLERIESYQKENNYATRSKATVDLIKKGLDILKEEKPALNQEDGPPGYENLTPANRAIVDRLIADLAAAQPPDD